MSSQEQRGSQKIKKVTNQDDRQYGCPCGKRYLSYPALFTHVKQKHGGKAPGQLIKPKKDSTVKRGRPPNHPNDQTQSDELDHVNLDQYFTNVINEDNNTINGQFHFQWKSGVSNCNQIFSKFLKQLGKDQSKKKVLVCLVLIMRDHLIDKNGQKYCEEENASEIIDISNQIVDSWEKYSEKYPINIKTLIDLIWGFFTWLYKEKLTNHKLEKMK